MNIGAAGDCVEGRKPGPVTLRSTVWAHSCYKSPVSVRSSSPGPSVPPPHQPGGSWYGPGIWGEGEGHNCPSRGIQQGQGTLGTGSTCIPRQVPSHGVVCSPLCSEPGVECPCIFQVTQEEEPGTEAGALGMVSWEQSQLCLWILPPNPLPQDLPAHRLLE